MANIYDINGNPIDIMQNPLDDLLPDRLLIWHDEFLSPTIDKTKWDNVYGDYRGYNWNSKDIMRNISSGEGMSFWTAKDFPKPYTDFSGAYISTNNKFEFRYGRIEAKIRFPSVSPHHTTFWTLGACEEVISVGEDAQYDETKGVNFPSNGEIDIAEYDNGRVGAVMHWASDGFDGTQYASGGSISSLTNSPYNWHIYACEWTEEKITFFVDGIEKGSWDTSNAKVGNWNPFQIPHYLVLDCISALSGTINWNIAKTDCKWVRVYAPIGVQNYIKETNITIPESAAISVGERYYLSPTFTPENPSDMTLNWESYNPDIATCYGGMVIGVAQGTAIIKVVSRHNCTAFCKVTVR